MSFPDRLKGNIRYRSTSFGVVAAGATSVNMLTTPDDSERRMVTGIMATPQAVGIRYQVKRAGYIAADIDGSLLVDGQGYTMLDLPYEQGIQYEVDVFNNSVGASIAAGVTLRIELVDQPTPV